MIVDQEKYVGDDWTFSFGELGSFVGVSHQHAWEMILSWKKGQDLGFLMWDWAYWVEGKVIVKTKTIVTELGL